MKFFFFDIDGTLIDEKNKIYEIPPKTAQMLHKLQAQGNKIIVCTGRAKGYLPISILKQNFDGYITTNGSYVEFENKILFQQSIDPIIVEKVKDVFLKYDSQIILECQKYCWIEDIKDSLIQKFISTYKVDTTIFKEWSLNNMNDGYYKITGIFKDDISRSKIETELKDIVKILDHSNRTYADINEKKMNKAVGIHILATKLNLNNHDLYAFGDGANDYEMLDYVGNGFKMYRHNRKLDTLAIKCCGKVEEEGIYEALQKEGIL